MDNTPLADFLSNTPPLLTSALVQLAPFIAAFSRLLHALSWSSSSWYDSWLALALWWAACLVSIQLLRYLLPTAALALLLFVDWRRKRRQTQNVVTEQVLQSVIADLSAIQSLLPQTPSFHIPSLYLTLRTCAILQLPYFVLTYFLSFRVTVAIIGTVLITWRAPWAVVLRATLWHSAWIRWASYSIWAKISGQPLHVPKMSLQTTSAAPTPTNSLRFLFTIYENQRWWMGLDWTAALLPGERPSWCAASQHPVSPPNAFILPDNTIVYLHSGKDKRIKRTAQWKWDEPEWRVLVRKDGGSLSRVERPLPSPKEDTPNSSRLLRAAGRLRESGGLHSSAGNSEHKDDTAVVDEENETAEEEPSTDSDGWIYGDNKWEARSNRGGLGKYTRYRRWTRVGVVSEVIEEVENGETGIQRPVHVHVNEENALTQRLKNALNK